MGAVNRAVDLRDRLGPEMAITILAARPVADLFQLAKTKMAESIGIDLEDNVTIGGVCVLFKKMKSRVWALDKITASASIERARRDRSDTTSRVASRVKDIDRVVVR